MTTEPQQPRVLVMMAAYNGEKYLAEQIESILSQQDVQVDLLIADDCSTDSTPEICRAYADRLPNVVFVQQQQNLGCAANFMSMLLAADPDGHDYFAFSDQDDVWLPQKLAAGVAKLQASGKRCSLYYSDVRDVNADLSDAHSEFGGFIPCQNRLKPVLAYGFAAGCTMVFDSDLCRLAQRNVPRDLQRYHDGWLHLVALTCANVVPDLMHSYILRRVAGQNIVGDKTPGQLGARRLASLARKLARPNRSLTLTARLACEEYGDLMAADVYEQVHDFSQLNRSLASRVRYATDPGFWVPLPKELLVIRTKMLLGVM